MRGTLANYKENLNKIALDVHQDDDGIYGSSNGDDMSVSDRRNSHRFANSKSGSWSPVSNGLDHIMKVKRFFSFSFREEMGQWTTSLLLAHGVQINLTALSSLYGFGQPSQAGTCVLMLVSLVQTVWLFFRDMIKGIILVIVLAPPIVSAIIIIVQKGGPYLAIYLWAFMFVPSLVMMTLYPILIAPLFNKFTPLPKGELREKIEKLASSLKFPLKKLFVVVGSTRSSHSNVRIQFLFRYWVLLVLFHFF